jgi:hypothetical protein
MTESLKIAKFENIDLTDPFFDSLKEDYREFSNWFNRKAKESALVFQNLQSLRLDGFLYIKTEIDELTDCEPKLPAKRRLKVGTFKINPHGTKLGERFIKRIFDEAVEREVLSIYVTIFDKHAHLIAIFRRYGFKKVAVKKTDNGIEQVFERSLTELSDNLVENFPRIPLTKDRHFALSIQPQYHSRLLPDSLLTTEDASILDDVSHTNSIHKLYLTAMSLAQNLRRGDTLLMYRTQSGGSAYYTSVVTSLCVVEELRHISEFTETAIFLDYCRPYSVFTEDELRSYYQTKKYPWIIRFTYNIALKKRVTRKALLEEVGIPRDIYSGIFQITTRQLKAILKLSNDYEKARSLIYTP